MLAVGEVRRSRVERIWLWDFTLYIYSGRFFFFSIFQIFVLISSNMSRYARYYSGGFYCFLTRFKV